MKLTRKQFVEYIKQIIPNDLNEIEKLAFIETEIAKQISFDEQYLWGDKESKEKIYKLAKTQAQKPHKEIKRKLICVTMAELFGHVVKELEFEVLYQKRAPGQENQTGDNDIFKKVSPKRQEHVCPIVKLSDGKYIEVDIQSDLYRLQTRSKPKAFGKNLFKIADGINTSIIDNSTVEKTFRKIYQLQENERFTDDYIAVFSAMLRCQGKTPIEMLEFFMNDPKIQEELKNTRCIEANKLYKKILATSYDLVQGNQFLNDNDTDKAIIEECILSNDKGQKRYSFCIFAQNEEKQQFYIYSKKSRRMINLSQEEMQQMTGQVMSIQLRGRPSQMKNELMSFVKGENANSENLSKSNAMISLEDIFLEEDEEELE